MQMLWLLVQVTVAAQSPLAGAEPSPLMAPATAIAAAPARHVRLVITESVFDNLRAIADTARAETVRCLVGVVRGDSAYIDLAWQPPISYADEGYVVFTGCPAATIAQWHNHIRDRRFASEYACYLSSVDVDAAQDDRSPPVQMVQVDDRVMCWWTRSQVRAGAGATILPPVRGQLSGSASLDESMCVGEARAALGCQLLQSRERLAVRRN